MKFEEGKVYRVTALDHFGTIDASRKFTMKWVGPFLGENSDYIFLAQMMQSTDQEPRPLPNGEHAILKSAILDIEESTGWRKAGSIIDRIKFWIRGR
jgi:hypothetical protein